MKGRIFQFLLFLFVTVTIAAISTMIPDNKTTIDAARSTGGNSLQSLNMRAADLERSVDKWNVTHIVLTGIAALFTGLTIWTSFIVRNENRRLDAAQAEFTAEKDRVSNEKARANELETARANERAAKLEESSEESRKETEALKLETAKANTAAAEAQLKLEQLRRQVAPRVVDREKFLAALAGQPTSPVEIMYLKDDPECEALAIQLFFLLEKSGWKPTRHPFPIPDVFPSVKLPFGDSTAVRVGGLTSGVSVASRKLSNAETDAYLKRKKGEEWVKTPYTVLFHALLDSVGGVSGSTGGMAPPPEGTIRVVVSHR